MKTLTVGDTQLACVDRGNGTPVLLVHGFPFDHTMWAGQIDVLCSEYRVLAVDLRGFGRSWVSHVSAVTMEQFADDLNTMLDVLGVDEPIVYCGLSMGGYIGFQFWRKCGARLRGLVLCDTRAAADSAEAAASRHAMADRVLAEGPGPLVETMLPRLFAEQTRKERPELVAGLQRVMMGNSPQGIAAAARGMAARPDMTGALGEIGCPALVVVGQEDAISTPAEMRGMAEPIRGSTFAEVPCAGHMSPLENAAAFNVAILDFLATLE